MEEFAGMNNKQNFFLMHRNDIAAALEIDIDSGNIVQVSRNVIPELLPLGGQLSRQELVKWWNRRAVPLTRKGMGDVLLKLNLQSVGSLLVSNLALSLTDHYWIRPAASDLTWEQVNLYNNDFRDVIGEFQFSHRVEELQSGSTEVS